MVRSFPILFICIVAWSAEPVELGLAAQFPGDRGIENHKDVLFTEDFEAPDIAGVVTHWTEAKNKDKKVLTLSSDAVPGSPGKQSLCMTATRGQNDGGHLWKLFDKGVDTMHARFYVKFAKDHPYVHHFVKIGAWINSPRWPQGEAGKRHDGARSFQTGIEPASGYGKYEPPGAWHFYTYWNDMRSWQGPNGTSFYGNGFAPAEPVLIPRDKWICVEFMVKANSIVDATDGEQAFWVDGKLMGRWAPGTPTGKWKGDHFDAGAGEPFPGYRWRTSEKLKINVFWLLYYMEQVFGGSEQYKNQTGAQLNNDVAQVWFDHVVIATSHIGPLQPLQ